MYLLTHMLSNRGAAISSFAFLSSAFAGFHLYVILGEFLAFGAFASWLRSNWVPFTRQVWAYIVDHLPVINLRLDDADKDALTSAAFFAPLFLNAYLRRRAPAFPWMARRWPITYEIINAPAMVFTLSTVIALVIARQSFSDAAGSIAFLGQVWLPPITPGKVLLAFLQLILVVVPIAVILSPIASGIVGLIADVVPNEGASRRLDTLATALFAVCIYGFAAVPVILLLNYVACLYVALTPIRATAVAIALTGALFATAQSPLRVWQITVFLLTLIVAGYVWDMARFIFEDITARPSES